MLADEAGHRPGRAAAAQLHQRVPVHHGRRPRRTTPATTRRRSTSARAVRTTTQLRAPPQEARRRGKLLGIGLSTYVEICGWRRQPSPRRSASRRRRLGVVDGARAPDRQGDGDHRLLAARPGARDVVVADHRDRARHAVRRRRGDPRRHGLRALRPRHLRHRARSPWAARRCTGRCRRCKDKARQIAAHHAGGRSPEDLEFEDGRFRVKGSPEQGEAIQEIACRGLGRASTCRDGIEPGLEATTFLDPPNFTFPFGTHVCEVEVDPETGKVEIVRYIAVDDCGNVINPMIVDGQVHGGVAQAIGQALFEESRLRRRRPAADRRRSSTT